jgi:membrane associated rhomboid family serine protease
MFPIRDDQPTFSAPFVTYFLIGLNCLIYFFEWQLGMQSPRVANAFIFQFATVPHRELGLLTGVPVFSPFLAFLPMFTSMFLHGSWLHVITNMWALWIFGDNIEDYLGHFRYLTFYLLCGLAAGFTHIVFNASSQTPTVGASGALAGVMGAYFVLYPHARVRTWPLFILKLPAWLVLAFWIIPQFLIGAEVSLGGRPQLAGGIAVWAHVGGFVVGILLIKLFPQRPHRYRYGTW